MVGLSKAPHAILMVGLLEFPVFVWLDSQRLPGFRMFRFSEVLRFRMVVLLEAPGIRMVGLLDGPRCLYGWNLRCSPVFVWLNTLEPPGFRTVRLLEVFRFRMVVLLERPSGTRMVGLLEATRFSYG